MQYTEKDIQQAKQFVLKRVEAEISVQSRLDEALLWAAKEIIAIAYKYSIAPKLFRFSVNPQLKKDVDAVLEKLREMLYDYVVAYSVAVDKDERDGIIALINQETYGHTLKERINTYVGRFKFELEAFIAAGLLHGLSKDKLLSSVRANLSNPYNNQLFRTTAVQGGMVATRIHTGGISYGQGHSNSSRNTLVTLLRTTVALAWMSIWGNRHKGAKGFYSFRGSSYPCAWCDDMVGYHPIEEYKGLWHPRCRCFFVFV